MSCFYLKSQHSGEWILSPSSGETYSDPIDRASPYLRTPVPTPDRVYKPRTAQTICEN
jgi:hypothetical protein